MQSNGHRCNHYSFLPLVYFPFLFRIHKLEDSFPKILEKKMNSSVICFPLHTRLIKIYVRGWNLFSHLINITPSWIQGLFLMQVIIPQLNITKASGGRKWKSKERKIKKEGIPHKRQIHTYIPKTGIQKRQNRKEKTKKKRNRGVTPKAP